MEEKDLKINVTEEPAVEAEAEEMTAEPAERELPEETPEAAAEPKRKACCKKSCCKDAKKSICTAFAIGAACLTILAAVGCAIWFWNKRGGKQIVCERLNKGINLLIR